MQFLAAVFFIVLVKCSIGSVASVWDSQSVVLPESRIIGGSPAAAGQFPYMVGLIIIVERPGFGTCGGALIAANYVLTCAHCLIIYDTIHMEVHLGALELTKDNSTHLVVIVPKENLIPNKDYDQTSVQDDIGLVKLPQKVEFTNTIQPIALPRRSDVNLDLVGKFVTMPGWGRFSDDIPDLSQYLQYTEAPILHQRICKHYYSVTLPSTLCVATDLGKGSCNSDAGGPLAYIDPKTHRNLVVGVVTFGRFPCVKDGWPGGNTRVTSYLDWIEANSDIEILP